MLVLLDLLSGLGPPGNISGNLPGVHVHAAICAIVLPAPGPQI